MNFIGCDLQECKEAQDILVVTHEGTSTMKLSQL